MDSTHVLRAPINSRVQVWIRIYPYFYICICLFLFFIIESAKPASPVVKRTIRGGLVTTITVFGLLLIIGSVGIAVGFVYFQRKRQRRRQFTYSLESTSDDWEPTGTGYYLFDNWSNNRRGGNNNDNIVIESNEHMPITTNVINRWC